MTQKPSAAMSSAGFVHLHVHSAYSLLKGSIKIQKLAELAKADRQPALALTDTDNMFGALEFSDKMAGYGIQPIIGCELAVDFGDQDPNARNALAAGPARIVLLAARERGYRSLMRLNSRAFLETPIHQAPHIKFEWLQGDAEDLIALTGGPEGPISLAINADHGSLAATRCDRLASLFGDRFYIELQRHGIEKERRAEAALIDLAYAKGFPVVATNEPYFATADDYEAHDALLCIAGGRLIAETDRDQLTPDHRFKTRAEMAVLFADVPEALASTIEIAERCSFRPTTRKPILPRFTVGAGTHAADAESDEAAELRRQAEEGLSNRIKVHGLSQGASEEDYRARLAFELDVITRMNYAGYFLIVADFIKWAKAEGIPVGPGRGSGAGSLVAYALTITDLDPIQFSLLFERFLNPERVSMPDFDIDFCQDGRDQVIHYVQQRYGRDQVAQIITFGTLQARGVLRDVGRVLQMPYGQVDKLTKLVPQNPAAPVTLAAAIASEPKLQAERDGDPVVKRAFDIAKKLEGLTRHASTHAAGIVIGDRALTELVPLYRDPKSDMPVTQFNMKWVEQAGLVKFDFLGLKTLTVLQTAVALVARRGIDIDLTAIPLDDKKTYDLLTRAEAVGVFQLESAGMRRALLDMRPDRFEDIIALVALYRPGPMANIPTYCARKHGMEQPDYIHPKLESVLKETFGVIVYQEQVMQAAQILAGFTLGQADLLRRAMGKKIRKEMQAQRNNFVEGAIKNNIERYQADAIFDLLERFAEYGFNKSHAAAYALVAYQTAYMKANFPVEFLAASMTLDMGNTDKLAEFRAEAERLGAEFGELVGIAHVERHRRRQELDREIRLHIGGLVGDQRVSRGVALVEAVFGEALEQIEDGVGLVALDVIFYRTLDEIVALRLHLLANFLAHGAAQQIGLTEGEAGQDLRGLHHLFLIDDDAEGLFQDGFELGMNVIGLLHAVLARAIGRNVRHRTGAIKRDQGDDVLETVGPHVEQRAPHAGAFQLEHANRFRARQQIVGFLVVERDGGEIDVDAAPGHQRDRGLQHRERLQAEKVEFHQPGLLHPFHVELSDRHIGFRIAIERHQFGERAVADHDAGGMRRGVAGEAFQLLGDVKGALDHRIAIALGL